MEQARLVVPDSRLGGAHRAFATGQHIDEVRGAEQRATHPDIGPGTLLDARNVHPAPGPTRGRVRRQHLNSIVVGAAHDDGVCRDILSSEVIGEGDRADPRKPVREVPGGGQQRDHRVEVAIGSRAGASAGQRFSPPAIGDASGLPASPQDVFGGDGPACRSTRARHSACAGRPAGQRLGRGGQHPGDAPRARRLRTEFGQVGGPGQGPGEEQIRRCRRPLGERGPTQAPAQAAQGDGVRAGIGRGEQVEGNLGRQEPASVGVLGERIGAGGQAVGHPIGRGAHQRQEGANGILIRERQIAIGFRDGDVRRRQHPPHDISSALTAHDDCQISPGNAIQEVGTTQGIGDMRRLLCGRPKDVDLHRISSLVAVIGDQ